MVVWNKMILSCLVCINLPNERNEINKVLFIMVLNCESKDIIATCCMGTLATLGQNHIAREIPDQT